MAASIRSRKTVTLWRIIKGGFSNFVRNAWLSIAAMAVMVVTLSIVLFSFISNQTFSHTIEEIRSRIDVSVYLKDDITEDQRRDLTQKIEALDNVKTVQYVSKEEALQSFVDANSQNIELQLAIVQADNKIPASLRVNLYNPDIIDELKTFLDQPDIKDLQSDETSYSGDRKEAIDKISKATTFIRQAGIAGVIIFAAISSLIIFNTIQMAIFNRRDELSIMKLLGASRGYIRGPFLVESMLIGIFAALISVALCKGVFTIASGTLDASTFGLLDISYSEVYFNQHFWLILVAQLTLGITIGVASSYLATFKYLRLNK